MSSNVDLHFCDLCGLSIPQRDLDSDLAKSINGKTVGVCCLSLILDQSAGSGAAHGHKGHGGGKAQAGSPASVAGISAPGVAQFSSTSLFPTAILLVALAGAAAFLEWRSSDRAVRTRTEIRGLVTNLEGAQKSLDELEAKLSSIPSKSIEAKLLALQADSDRIRLSITEIKPADDSAIKDQLKQLGLRLEDMVGRFASMEVRQGALARSVQGGFHDLAKELGQMGASMPRQASPLGKTAGSDGEEKGAGPSVGASLALPDDLAKEVAKLSDKEAGVRWAAIDALLSKKDPRVVPHLVPTLKDEDPFIRRLTATGLGKLGDKRAIWPLFDAMADSESIVRSAAYRSLVKITKEFGKPLAFDPDASKDKRRTALKKWKAWLEKRMAH